MNIRYSNNTRGAAPGTSRRIRRLSPERSAATHHHHAGGGGAAGLLRSLRLSKSGKALPAGQAARSPFGDMILPARALQLMWAPLAVRSERSTIWPLDGSGRGPSATTTCSHGPWVIA